MAREGGLTGISGGKEQKAARGRGRRLSAWLRANALPLVSLGFVASTTAMAFIIANRGMDGPAALYAQGIVGNERMPLDEKMVAWKYRLTRDKKSVCNGDYDSVIREMQDEMFRYARKGDKESADKIWHAMETFMAIRISSVENGDCERAGNGAKAGK